MQRVGKWHQIQRVKLGFGGLEKSREYLDSDEYLEKQIKNLSEKSWMLYGKMERDIARAVRQRREYVKNGKEISNIKNWEKKTEKKMKNQMDFEQTKNQVIANLKRLIPLICLVLFFISCASFQKEGVVIGEAENLRYFSIASHNKMSVGNQTDVGLDTSVPITGIPTPLGINMGGTGFLTSRRFNVEKVGTIEFIELVSRNEDVRDIVEAIKAIPIEFFSTNQFLEEEK